MKKQLFLLSSIVSICFAANLKAQTPTLTEVILPQYIEGNSSSNTTRLPYAYRVSLSNLDTNATYRYYNQVVTSSDSPTANGAGNCIFANSNSFKRSTSPGLSTNGSYGTFTTDSTGVYTGWFITEPTGNSRFTNGNHVFMRIMLNNGAGGTSVATRLTTVDSVTVLNLNTGATNGTGLMGTSMATPRNFVFAYDNVNGTGRPVSGSYVENDSVANTTANNYASFYDTNVDSVDGAYGFVIPNTNANGIQRIEQRDFATAMLVGCAAVDSNGVWPSGANTINPVGGTTPIVITINDASLDPNASSVGGIITSNDTVCSGTNMNTLWLSGYTGSIIKWQYSTDNFSSDINDTLNMTDSLAYLNLTQSTYYRVIVQNGTCPSANSSMAMISVLTPATAALAAFTTPICSTGSPLTLTGGTPSGGTYSGTGVDFGAFDPTVSGIGTFVITYTIVDSICTSSDTASIMVSLCTGTNEFSNGFISIYPNPSSSMVNISLQQADIKELNITLIDVQGRELYTEAIRNINPNFNKQIGLEKFAKGVYYIKLNYTDSKSNSQAKTSKLIIQ